MAAKAMAEGLGSINMQARAGKFKDIVLLQSKLVSGDGQTTRP